MDWITFGSNLIASIAWPLAIVIVVFWLKEHIKELLPFVRKVRYGNVEVDFAEITERKTVEVLEEKFKEWGTYANGMLERQNISEVKIKTLRDEINSLVSNVVQETRQVERDVQTEAVRRRVIGALKDNQPMRLSHLVELLTVFYGLPMSTVRRQITDLWTERKISSSDHDALADRSELTLTGN